MKNNLSNWGISFFNKRLRNIELRVIFWFQKTVLHHKINNKTRSTKDLENSVECFGKNYFASHLVKFLNPEELELLECTLVITFLTKIVSEGLPTSFNFSRGSS